MVIREGYLYHIKDDYFELAEKHSCSQWLMKNRGNDFRPVCFCIRDTHEPDILWMIPLSRNKSKYEDTYKNDTDKYGKCYKFVFFNKRCSVALIQNCFPITQSYIDHAHTVNDIHYRLRDDVYEEIKATFEIAIEKYKYGTPVIFTRVDQLYKLMKDELEKLKVIADPEQVVEQEQAAERNGLSMSEWKSEINRLRSERQSEHGNDVILQKNYHLQK